jgi:hypothetical protein
MLAQLRCRRRILSEDGPTLISLRKSSKHVEENQIFIHYRILGYPNTCSIVFVSVFAAMAIPNFLHPFDSRLTQMRISPIRL